MLKCAQNRPICAHLSMLAAWGLASHLVLRNLWDFRSHQLLRGMLCPIKLEGS
ncbi:Uncharacterised protein [Mycobacteroides abscessus subsp. abscessus]|nr:Uncharacterised protein [Mycobacteroides abscessus subsp. abscessus]